MKSIKEVFEKYIKDINETVYSFTKSRVIIILNQLQSEIQEIHDKEIERLKGLIELIDEDGKLTKLSEENNQLKQQLKERDTFCNDAWTFLGQRNELRKKIEDKIKEFEHAKKLEQEKLESGIESTFTVTSINLVNNYIKILENLLEVDKNE